MIDSEQTFKKEKKKGKRIRGKNKRGKNKKSQIRIIIRKNI